MSIPPCAQALLGDFDFDSVESSQFIMGPLYFVFFVGIAVLVVLSECTHRAREHRQSCHSRSPLTTIVVIVVSLQQTF